MLAQLAGDTLRIDAATGFLVTAAAISSTPRRSPIRCRFCT
jgi:hypothetical protein